jgi:hypothetical protein
MTDCFCVRGKYALIAALAGVPLGLITFFTLAPEDGAAAAAATGIATGFLTGGIAAAYVAWRDRAWAKWAKALCSQYEQEGVIHHGQARTGHSLAMDLAKVLTRAWVLYPKVGIDGWLVLTSQRLVFHPRESGPRTIEIAVSEIAGVRRGGSIIAKTLEVRVRDVGSIVIRVRKPDEWLDSFAGREGITVLR